MKNLLLVLLLSLGACSMKCQTGVVKVIGGCDMNGSCGVLFENGSTGRVHKPVVGGTGRSCVFTDAAE